MNMTTYLTSLPTATVLYYHHMSMYDMGKGGVHYNGVVIVHKG